MMKAIVGICALLFLIGCAPTQPPLLTAQDILSSPQDYLGKEVEVHGTLQASSLLRCTRQFCGEEEPCCNTCGGDAVLGSALGELIVSPVTCSGTNCGVDCSPFPIGTEGPFTGTLEERDGSLVLVLSAYEP